MNPLKRYILSHFKEDFLKQHFKDVAAKNKYQLEVVHTDSNGVSYLGFGEKPLPLERLGKMRDFMDLMGSGLSREELTDLCASADNQLALAMAGKPSKASHVGWVLGQIQDRVHNILHTELLYNFLAVQLIREDEPVNQFVESIHKEKIEQFKKDNEGSSTFFFFQVPQLKLVNERLKFSQAEWDASWNESLRQQQEMRRRLDLLATLKGSSKETRTKRRTAL